MKYTMSSEVLVAEGLAENSSSVMSDSLGFFQLMPRRFVGSISWLGNALLRMFRNGIRFYLERSYVHSKDYDVAMYRKTCRGAVPYHLWRRHSAFLYDSGKEMG